MEKLLKLLNEYDSGWAYDDYYGPFQYGQDCDAYHLCKYQLVSKEYGFIKWLVDNDKIDFESKVYPLKKYYPYFNDDVLAIVSQDCNTYEDHCRVCYDKYESLLMLLAISDTPIDDLISYLK